MAQLQYIGARYVPIWYHNSVNDTADWEINVEYEPLTFVTTPNNHLYISKKEVPDNIGTPAENTEYWLDMGVYTGQSTEALQEEIDALTLELNGVKENVEDNATAISKLSRFDYDKFAGKKIFILGDSLSHNTINPPNWVESFNTKLNGIADTITVNAAGGRTIKTGADELALMSNLEYDYLIVFLGTNDFTSNYPLGDNFSATGTSTIGGLNALKSAIASAFVKPPEVFFVTPPRRSDKIITTNKTILEMYRQAIYAYCKSEGWNIISLSAAPFLSDPTTFTSDGLHISSAYAEKLSNWIITNMLSGGTGAVNLNGEGVNLASLFNAGINGSAAIEVNGNKLIYTMSFNGMGLDHSTGSVALVDVPSELQNKYGNIEIMWPGQVWVGGVGCYSCGCRFVNNNLYIFVNNTANVTGDVQIKFELLPGYCNKLAFNA